MHMDPYFQLTGTTYKKLNDARFDASQADIAILQFTTKEIEYLMELTQAKLEETTKIEEQMKYNALCAQLNEEARKRKLEESIRVSEQLALAAQIEDRPSFLTNDSSRKRRKTNPKSDYRSSYSTRDSYPSESYGTTNSRNSSPHHRDRDRDRDRTRRSDRRRDSRSFNGSGESSKNSGGGYHSSSHHRERSDHRDHHRSSEQNQPSSSSRGGNRESYPRNSIGHTRESYGGINPSSGRNSYGGNVNQKDIHPPPFGGPSYRHGGNVKHTKIIQRSSGPPPDNYVCRKCNIPGHYIRDCTMGHQKSAKPPSNYTCHRCGNAGHWIEHCPENTPPPGYICHKCNQKGHFIKNCPQQRSNNSSPQQQQQRSSKQQQQHSNNSNNNSIVDGNDTDDSGQQQRTYQREEIEEQQRGEHPEIIMGHDNLPEPIVVKALGAE